MQLDFLFFINSVLLGIGLAMDAFSVSMANGLNEPRMKNAKLIGISGTFGVFQALMPLIGWFCVHTVVEYFSLFEIYIPYVSLLLLGYIGVKMIIDGVRQKNATSQKQSLGIAHLLMQAVATSIDALSVGFTIADYKFLTTLICAIIIAVVTFLICIAGLLIGKKFGTKLSGKASIFGGTILVAIGIEIFITGIIK